MPVEVESMAYRFMSATDVPWHGLGEQVTANQSIDEWLKIARLDWSVQRRKLFMRNDRSEQYATHEVPDQYAIVRDKDNKVYGIFSDRYHIVQNQTMVEFFREYTESGGMEIETLGALRDGATIWCLAKIGKDFTLRGNDTTKGYVLLANSHDGTMSYQGQTTGVRVVCMNTLRAALDEKSNCMFKMRHSRKVTKEVQEDAKKKMGLAVQSFERMHETAQMLSESKVQDKALVLQYLSQLNGGGFLLEEAIKGYEDTQAVQHAKATGGSILDAIVSDDVMIDHETGKAINKKYKLTPDMFNRAGKQIIDSIVDAPGAKMESSKGTWWGVVNGVSYYTDHLAGRNADTTLSSAWWGQRAGLKDQAVELAVKYATAN